MMHSMSTYQKKILHEMKLFSNVGQRSKGHGAEAKLNFLIFSTLIYFVHHIISNFDEVLTRVPSWGCVDSLKIP